MILQEFLILEVHRLDWRCLALVRVYEIAKRFEVVVGFQQLLSFDAEGARDPQRLVTDSAVEAQEVVQFIGRKEVPEGYRSANALLVGMIREEALFGFFVHSPINAPNALHQSHGIPVEVVVDQAGSVLKVQAF